MRCFILKNYSMLTNVFNKIIDFLEKGEEVEFSCGGPYL